MAGKKTTSSPKNYELAPGISRFSAGRMFHKRALWKKIAKGEKAKPKEYKDPNVIVKPIGGKKNGNERRVLVKKPGRYLPQVSETLKKRTRSSKKEVLRKSITPGTVLILLGSRHRGKRVVFLKQLDSGLLLVTGPLRFNGTPLRRIPQAFVIATKTKADISGVKIPEHINDEYFKRADNAKAKKKAEGDLFAQSKAYSVTDQRKADQKSVDAAVSAALKKHSEYKFLKAYLASKFSIKKGEQPHNLVF